MYVEQAVVLTIRKSMSLSLYVPYYRDFYRHRHTINENWKIINNNAHLSAHKHCNDVSYRVLLILPSSTFLRRNQSHVYNSGEWFYLLYIN